MRKKLNSETGLTLVEMLAAVVILVLLLGTGLQMAVHTYETMIAQSEVELLLSSAVDAVSNELRYAWDVSGTGSSYTYSTSYGKGLCLDLDDGQIVVRNYDGSAKHLLLSTGAYGKVEDAYKKYEIRKIDWTTPIIAFDDSSGDVIFTINLKVVLADDSSENIGASTPNGGVTVRCLNPKIEDTTGG